MSEAALLAESATARKSKSDTWPAEIDLLLACGRMDVRPEDVQRIRSILTSHFDWERCIRLMVYHRMTGFLYRNISLAASDLVPTEYLQALRIRFLQDGAETLRDTAELLGILDVLSAGGVMAVPYKGPALAAMVYGNVAYRKCNDLDILVSRGDVPLARELLERAGFSPLFPTTPAGRDFLLRTRHSEIFTKNPWPIVELHWRFAKQRGVFPLSLDELRPRLQTVSMGGASIPVFAPEDQLLVLCVHGANHMWSRLEWLCGVSELIRTHPISWQVALDRAYALHAEKALLLGMGLARELLDAPVPSEVIARAAADGDVVRLNEIVKNRLAKTDLEQTQPRNSLTRDIFRLRLQSTTGARLRYVLHRVTTPTRENTRFMLPFGLPLPALLRPFHILGRLARALQREP